MLHVRGAEVVEMTESGRRTELRGGRVLERHPQATATRQATGFRIQGGPNRRMINATTTPGRAT